MPVDGIQVTIAFQFGRLNESCRFRQASASSGIYLPDLFWEPMSRRLHNWSYDNVTDFLKENGFAFYREVGGSHEAWIKRGEDKVPDKVVGMYFTHSSYSVGTMKRMIRTSGIEEDEWIKWSVS
jgi:hypothetical protein